MLLSLIPLIIQILVVSNRSSENRQMKVKNNKTMIRNIKMQTELLINNIRQKKIKIQKIIKSISMILVFKRNRKIVKILSEALKWK